MLYIMEKYAIVWIANGFEPHDPARVDEFSRRSLRDAVARYHELKILKNRVYFVNINSVVRETTGVVVLRDTLRNEALNAGVDHSDLLLTVIETTGSPTDGLAIAKFAKTYPHIRIEAYTTIPEAAAFFQVMYRAVAKWIEKFELNFSIYSVKDISCSLQSRFFYSGMRWITFAASQTSVTFKIWFHLLNFAYARRLRGFGRTVK